MKEIIRSLQLYALLLVWCALCLAAQQSRGGTMSPRRASTSSASLSPTAPSTTPPITRIVDVVDADILPRSRSNYLFRLRWKGIKRVQSPVGERADGTPVKKVDRLYIDQLKVSDPEIFAFITRETARQLEGINMIASENYASLAVLGALGSPLTNKYSEGLPGRRYYSGTEHIDSIERICQERALRAFGLDDMRNGGPWAVNVQAYSGSIANFAVYTALLHKSTAPRGPILALDLTSGGHLSHGHRTPSRNISATSMYFDTVFYSVHPESGLIDYDDVQRIATATRPRVIVAGASSYTRLINYERMRVIADSVGAYLVADIAHVAGLFIGEVSRRRLLTSQDEVTTSDYVGDTPSMLERHFNPFEHSHVVTTTTQKTLRGPRAAMIFHNRNFVSSTAINNAVFPALQGGPNNAAIAAVAVALGEAMTPEFVRYTRNVRRNAAVLAAQLAARGHCVVTNGTDNHIVMVHLGSIVSERCKCHLSGDKVEKLLELCGIYANKNVVPIAVCRSILPPPSSLSFSMSASLEANCSRPAATSVSPLGLRLGTAALTTRFPTASEADIRVLADIIHDGILLAQEACSVATCNTMASFLESLERPLMVLSLLGLKRRVSEFVARFPVPINISYAF